MTDIDNSTAVTRIASTWRGYYVRSVFAKVKAATNPHELESLIDAFYEMPEDKLSWAMVSIWNSALRYGLKRNNALKDHEENICKPGCISCAFEFEQQQMAYAGDESNYEDDNRRWSYHDDQDSEPRDWYWNEGGYCDW